MKGDVSRFLIPRDPERQCAGARRQTERLRDVLHADPATAVMTPARAVRTPGSVRQNPASPEFFMRSSCSPVT
jgi:hypothetical protein